MTSPLKTERVSDDRVAVMIAECKQHFDEAADMIGADGLQWLDDSIAALEELQQLRLQLTALQTSFAVLDDEYQKTLQLNRNAAVELERLTLAATASESLLTEAVEMLDGAFSGYIGGCGEDKAWERARVSVTARIRAALGATE